MKSLRRAALVLASVIALLSVVGSVLPGFDYSRQDREHFSSGPSAMHWLGTDSLGRDRLARLMHGTRVSLTLAPAAAGLSMLLAFVFGAMPGFRGGVAERAAKTAIDLMLSIPWLFLLLMVRAMLPLNTTPGGIGSHNFRDARDSGMGSAGAGPAGAGSRLARVGIRAGGAGRRYLPAAPAVGLRGPESVASAAGAILDCACRCSSWRRPI